MTGKSKILQEVLAATLLGNDMLHMKGHCWLLITMKLAVFALVACSFSDTPAQRRVH